MSSMTTEELEVAFRAHATELRSFLHRQLRNPETAADLTQETYLRLLRQPPRKPVLNLRGFIFKVARNLAIDHARSRQTRERLDEGTAYLYEVTGESPALFDVVVAQQELAAMAHALHRLPTQCQEIFTLCRLQNLPHKEVALQLQVSVSTVEKQLAIALDFLSQCLQR
ncbi:RNA polymerase sigma factor [Pseudomonas sp. WS 5111]|jgi:RNA polymerase sigma-70 factor (ECF subfamily)|uniref:RNA polymerase sigma factor n=1 Tax=unclassified Pseudomonas TaxID=196821 RepID=UPI001476301F|nr:MULTISPECIES: RNA polymerase sigma factor [unclassified Pseudomonas]NMX60244.1 RNA polymerase sigma factor [Pseudomonas sp. WS 5079]NMX66109.1 RNA polymerase sigma factor [Pseudomonas sp. WS 5111]NMX85442.1 RNA polymerase sigma factor [Pseudomonas sp. WS 5010]